MVEPDDVRAQTLSPVARRARPLPDGCESAVATVRLLAPVASTASSCLSAIVLIRPT